MIASNELRIGNWVMYNHPKQPYKTEVTFSLMGRAWVGDIDLDPIPLTPEILEKAGFVKLPMQFNGYQGWVKSDFEVGLGTYGFHYECSNREGEGNECLVSIYSLHQLQNLYFALTGTELNIQL